MTPLELIDGTHRGDAFLAALKGMRVAPETIGGALAENRTAPVRVAL